MGAILTVAQSKGGCAKSSTICALAPNLAAHGFRVCVVDSDRNQSFASWYSQVYEGPPLTCASEIDHIRVVDLAAAQAETHDVVFVDTAGFENLTAASAIGMADYVLIPCMADRGSVRETLRTAQQVASLAKAARRSIPYSVLLTRWKERGLAERAARDSLQEAGLPILEAAMSDTAEYSKLSFSGAVPMLGKVREQMDSLIGELWGKGVIPVNSGKQATGQAA